MEESSIAFKILISKPKENTAIGKPRFRWEDNIRIYLKEISVSIWRIIVNAALNLQVS